MKHNPPQKKKKKKKKLTFDLMKKVKKQPKKFEVQLNTSEIFKMGIKNK